MVTRVIAIHAFLDRPIIGDREDDGLCRSRLGLRGRRARRRAGGDAHIRVLERALRRLLGNGWGRGVGLGEVHDWQVRDGSRVRRRRRILAHGACRRHFDWYGLGRWHGAGLRQALQRGWLDHLRRVPARARAAGDVRPLLARSLRAGLQLPHALGGIELGLRVLAWLAFGFGNRLLRLGRRRSCARLRRSITLRSRPGFGQRAARCFHAEPGQRLGRSEIEVNRIRGFGCLSGVGQDGLDVAVGDEGVQRVVKLRCAHAGVLQQRLDSALAVH